MTKTAIFWNRVTRRGSQVEQDCLPFRSSWIHAGFYGGSYCPILYFRVVFCRPLFFFLSVFVWLFLFSVFWITASYYPFNISIFLICSFIILSSLTYAPSLFCHMYECINYHTYICKTRYSFILKSSKIVMWSISSFWEFCSTFDVFLYCCLSSKVVSFLECCFFLLFMC